MKTAVVVAHYDENLNWCLNLDSSFNIIIYSKTNRNYHFIDHNKGKDVPMYLKYIIDNYHNLPDKILFLHGHQMSYHQDFPSDYIIKNVDWNSSEYFSVNSRNSYQEVSSKFSKSENSFTWLRDNWSIFGGELPFPEDGLFFYPSSQFVVSKELITQYKKEFWINLYKWIETSELDSFISSRIIEYTWHYILTKNPKDQIINKIFINKNLKTLSVSLINFTMNEEKIEINPSVNIGNCVIEIKNIKTELLLSKCEMLMSTGYTYWVTLGQKKNELPGIIASLYKDLILIYEEYIYF